jgi:hypothetical protein
MLHLFTAYVEQRSNLLLENCMELTVPDKRIRNIPEVVLVRRWVSWGSGNLEGEGWVGGWGRGGSVYKQPETEVDDSCHS